MSKWDCLNYGGEWQSPYINFDNTFQSMIMIFVIQSGERFAEIYMAMIYSVGVDMQPQRQTNYVFALLHTILILLFAILFFNMFVGVVIEVYKTEQEKITKNHLLKKYQKTWIISQGLAYQTKP